MLRNSLALQSALNHMRWIAALIVVTSHARGLYFLPRSEVDGKSLMLDLFYLLSRMGQEAVVLFFVMSGLLIGGKFLSPENQDPVRFGNYLVARVSRLGVVAIPCILLCYALLQTGQPYSLEECSSAVVLLANLFFLQDILVPPLCNNPPLWSLSNEFWYYILFPLIIFSIKCRNSLPYLLAAFFLASAILFLDNYDDRMILLYFPAWLSGILVWHKKTPCLPTYITLPILMLCMVFARIPLYEQFFWAKDFLICISAVLFLKSTLRLKNKTSYIDRIGRKWADFSFSLYVIHYPLLLSVPPILVYMGLPSGELSPFAASSYSIYAGLILFSVLTGYIFSLLTERHTDKIRWLVQKVLTKREII
ncbi:acyltransferase family protein [Altericroceibacterium endophyticum]|uniref:Acyltransferase family protein n=1 Tax=Altericroceibacterium endophyticum TaxID=1808508 RepID=A0A6I4T7Y5_9SPHN|nr:acyltransferase [Altericroceibacterium endophyticum]MXO67076.1 acyltransferase family protein [Altericroceibacterium endophyticum]